MEKNKLDRKFHHHSWFKEGVTVRYALDYFARSGDFYLKQKPSKKQSNILFEEMQCDDVITDGRASYKLSEEEKQYYLERREIYASQMSTV